MKLKPYVFYIESFDGDSHTGVYVEDKDNLFYYIEYSWYVYRGIHGPYKTKEELYKGLSYYIYDSNFYKRIKRFSSNVDFTSIYNYDNITFDDFDRLCKLNSSLYTIDDQGTELIKDNSNGRLEYYSI